MTSMTQSPTLSVSPTALAALRPFVDAPEATGSAVRVTLDGYG